MKIFLSLSAISLFVNISSALAVTSPAPSSGAAAKPVAQNGLSSNSLTHIVKLKASNLRNITGFESTSFIKNHYNTFQGMKGGKLELMGFKPESNESPDKMKNIDIGQEFKAVVGSFNPSFVTYLSALKDVEYVEPNRVYKSNILPTTSKPQPYVANPPKHKSSVKRRKSSIIKRNSYTQFNVPSWGMARINQRSRDDLSSYTADDSAGTGIHVYILDTGIHTAHPDFAGRAQMDGNYIEYEDDNDYAGHGTHVAGTIGGNTYGIAKNTILHGVKILDRNGDGTTASLIQAVSHITQIAPPGRSIINLSLTGPRSNAIDEALSMAVRQYGIPVFVSAGNSGDDACEYSPPANPDVFAVGASNKNDVVPKFSSYGKCVRVYAPGTNITSTWLNGASHSMDGTSMANPHVTGIAAMLMSEFEFSSPNELYQSITSIATHGTLTSKKDQGRDILLAYNGADR